MIPGMVGLSTSQLQSTIAASTTNVEPSVQPHHPITCQSDLFYDEDGTFRCDHASAPPGDIRTHQCVTHSVALLIIELAMSL